MTFDELDRSLPNGFHDAWIKRIDIDYSARTVSLMTRILDGPSEDLPEKKNRLRDGRVLLEGLEFIVVEPPIEGGTPTKETEPWVDSYLSAPLPAVTKSFPTPPDCFLAALFVSQWNSSIFVAARNAVHQWIGP